MKKYIFSGDAEIMWDTRKVMVGGGGGGRGGNRNAQVQKTQAKRAFFELVHCLAPERPRFPALKGFPPQP